MTRKVACPLDPNAGFGLPAVFGGSNRGWGRVGDNTPGMRHPHPHKGWK